MRRLHRTKAKKWLKHPLCPTFRRRRQKKKVLSSICKWNDSFYSDRVIKEAIKDESFHDIFLCVQQLEKKKSLLLLSDSTPATSRPTHMNRTISLKDLSAIRCTVKCLALICHCWYTRLPDVLLCVLESGRSSWEEVQYLWDPVCEDFREAWFWQIIQYFGNRQAGHLLGARPLMLYV